MPVNTTARVRKFMPWELHDQCYQTQGTSVGLPSKGTANGSRVEAMEFLEFHQLFDQDSTNEQLFEGCAKPLCDNIICNGFNSILFAYGQTGSGKTFTLLGNPGKDDGVEGCLQLSIKYLLSNPKVESSSMQAVECYGIKSGKAAMFDLFDARNITGNHDWDDKISSFEMKEFVSKSIDKNSRPSDISKLIALAQSSAHYAPTGKNPQSSRGHIAFVIEICMTDGHRCDFICLDLAGSEGISAITPEFVAKVGEKTAQVRMMEGGAINFGLGQLQSLLSQIASKKGVSKVQGTGLRKALHPYVQQSKSPMVRGLFTLSPSITNIDSTRNTFRTANVIAGLKIKPVKVAKKKTAKQIIAELQKRVREQDLHIDKLKEEVSLLTEKNSDLIDQFQTLTADSDEEEEESENDESWNDESEETKSAKAVADLLTRSNTVQVDLDLVDLQRQKEKLLKSKKQLQNQLELDDVKGDKELEEGLIDDMTEIDEEMKQLDRNIFKMAQLDQEMNKAIMSDNRRNSNCYTRNATMISINEDEPLKLLTKCKTLQKTKDSVQCDGLPELVHVMQNKQLVQMKKENFNLLKERLEELAEMIEQKKKQQRERSENILQFVDNIQNEQKNLLQRLKKN